MADLLGGLAGLTIRAPRARMPGLALWGTGQDDDLVISRRNQPAPFPTPLEPAPTSTQPQAPTTELDWLEPLPRLCSWGTACGSLTLSRQCSASTAQGSPLASLRMRMWKPMGTRSPTSSLASREGSPACGQRWSTLGPGPFRHSSVLGNMLAQSLPFTSQAKHGFTSLTRRHTPTTPLGCQRLSSLSATDLVMVASMAELTETDDDLACSNQFQAHQPQPDNSSHPFAPEHSLPLHAVPALDLCTGTGCRPSQRHHVCSSVMGDCCPPPTPHPSIHSLPAIFRLPSACQPASISPFQAASVQVLPSPPPELDVSSFLDTWPATALSDTAPSTARAPTMTDPHCGLAFLSPIRPVHTPPRHSDRPVSHDILNHAHFHGLPAADEFYLDSVPAVSCNPYDTGNSGRLPAVFANPFLRVVDGNMGSNGSSALRDAEGLDALFPSVPAWMDGIGNADQDLPGLGEALQMSWVDWGALNSDQDSEASSDCSTLDTSTNSMELACQSEYDGLAQVVVPCLVHRGSETIVDL